MASDFTKGHRPCRKPDIQHAGCSPAAEAAIQHTDDSPGAASPEQGRKRTHVDACAGNVIYRGVMRDQPVIFGAVTCKSEDDDAILRCVHKCRLKGRAEGGMSCFFVHEQFGLEALNRVAKQRAQCRSVAGGPRQVPDERICVAVNTDEESAYPHV
ncbi:MAG: hypothetical protein EOS62_30670 [Mesorhizobium sp.]|nr:hypothetical protein [Mesorhizobium sp.]RWE64143.1 MAG: hypothetical protein EOS62_30670 [Mesorhizobium sp.]